MMSLVLCNHTNARPSFLVIGELRCLFPPSGFVGVEVEKLRLNWFWGIMIGKGVR
jgi:hypothetical protein